MGWLRTSVGAFLMVAPGAPMRLATDESPTSAALLLMRTIGIRDLVLGLGTVSAAQSLGQSDTRRWVKATLVSDALDTVVSLAAMRSYRKTGFASRRGFSIQRCLRRFQSTEDYLQRRQSMLHDT